MNAENRPEQYRVEDLGLEPGVEFVQPGQLKDPEAEAERIRKLNEALGSDGLPLEFIWVHFGGITSGWATLGFGIEEFDNGGRKGAAPKVSVMVPGHDIWSKKHGEVFTEVPPGSKSSNFSVVGDEY